MPTTFPSSHAGPDEGKPKKLTQFSLHSLSRFNFKANFSPKASYSQPLTPGVSVNLWLYFDSEPKMSLRHQLSRYRAEKQAETWGLIAAFATLLSRKVARERLQASATPLKDDVSSEKSADLDEKVDAEQDAK